jgi:hypothetical protein
MDESNWRHRLDVGQAEPWHLAEAQHPLRDDVKQAEAELQRG